jgi:hypothetical protein
MQRSILIALMASSTGLVGASDPPQAEIGNSQIKVKLYPPGRDAGYYRGTRFDWSGVIYSLEYAGHNYYGPWFDKTRPSVHDFIYENGDVIAGPCSAITGPVDEFGPLGWAEAKPGGTFIKIGVGALRKPPHDAVDQAYDHYTLYDIVDDGNWTTSQHPDSIEFVQNVADQPSGYGYSYRKVIRLASDRPQMVLEHHLLNIGKRAIQSTVYNHNFLVLDHQPPGPDFLISVPFPIRSPRPHDRPLTEVRGNQIVYLKTLVDQDTAAMPIEGFGASADDHEIRIENRRLGVGMRIKTDRPLSLASLWSIRTVLAMEPFVALNVEPGQEFSWTTTYDYYTLGAPQK